jgi:hypothetical protein
MDRNEQLNKMNSNAQQINLIDYIKSSRKLSQDPKVLRMIRSEFDIQMHKKRQQISEDRKKKFKDIKKYTLSINDLNNYGTIIKSLDKYTPKISYKIKRTIDPNENRKNIGQYLTSEENYDKLKQISCQFDPLKSAYISNSNDYKISEANGRDKEKEFSHQRKTINSFNLINSKREKIIPPMIINEKWSPFYENYYMTLLKNKNGFLEKGGLFTEFTNKNIYTININKRKNKEKFLREKLGLYTTSLNDNKTKDLKRYFNNNNFKRSSSIKYKFVGLNNFN